jgi:glycosyltransferase involved in cell wall biosynthesis
VLASVSDFLMTPESTPLPTSLTERGVLHIATEKTWRGGEQQAHHLIRGLKTRGVRQALVTPKSSKLAEGVIRSNYADVYNLPASGRYHPFNWWAVFRAIRHFRPAIIHAHTSHAHALGWFAGSRKTPLISTRRVDFPLKRGVSAGRRFTDTHCFQIAISEAIRELLIEFGCPAENVFLVPSGVDSRRFTAVSQADNRGKARNKIREELQVGDDTVLLGNTAALSDHKGQTYLLQALKLLADDPPQRKVVCVIAGEGELKESLQRELTELRLDQPDASITARLLGFRNDIPELLAALDVFVMPSHLEGLGTSVIDATCMGLPIVATRAGGVPDVISDGENGLLVPPRDPQLLADALRKIINEHDLARRLGDQARKSFESGPFRAGAMVEGNLNVYRDVLDRMADQ